MEYTRTLQQQAIFYKRCWLGLLLLFLFIFPKAGFKIGMLPVTIGYLLLSITTIALLCRGVFVLTQERANALMALLPFQCCILLSTTLYGVENVAHFCGVITAIIILPWLMLGIFSQTIEQIDIAMLLQTIRHGMFFLAVYGIFVFIAWIMTGKLLLIPFFAANMHDAESIQSIKCIIRGNLLKLISTYQNGILYGVSLLMLLPTYQVLEKAKWKKAIVKLSLILTLSRTIWIGLFLNEIFSLIFQKKKTPSTLFWFTAQIIMGILTLTTVLGTFNSNWQFIFDPSLGGRDAQLATLNNLSLFGKRFTGLPEILYLAVLEQFGVLGFFSLCIGLATPLIQYLLRPNKVDSPFARAFALGLMLYLIIACSDGAFQFIPVMAIYWGISSLLLSSRNLATLP